MGALPDEGCTPGAVYEAVTQRTLKTTICRPGWSKAHRRVTQKARALVWFNYGMIPQKGWEIDHLIPLELGGTNQTDNLFPQRPPYAHRKDKVENSLKRRVCARRIGLRKAQFGIAMDWRKFE